MTSYVFLTGVLRRYQKLALHQPPLEGVVAARVS